MSVQPHTSLHFQALIYVLSRDGVTVQDMVDQFLTNDNVARRWLNEMTKQGMVTVRHNALGHQYFMSVYSALIPRGTRPVKVPPPEVPGTHPVTVNPLQQPTN
jgi:hypothetical protein